MKLLQYTDDGDYVKVAILFDDNTYGATSVVSAGRDGKEILKDAYIILKSSERLKFNGNKDEYEDLIFEESKPHSMEIDFYNLSGKVYDQYGDLIPAEIIFSIEGTNKARIENNKLIEEEVKELTSYFIVAKCGELIKKDERFIYPLPQEEPKVASVEERLEATEKAMADVIMMIGGM